jgi:hypothetical protein
VADEYDRDLDEAAVDLEIDQPQVEAKKIREATYTSIAWPLFDQIIAEAKIEEGGYSNSWVVDDGVARIRIDERVLTRLLGVPLAIKGVASTSGVLADALDVWAAYELRRAGFDPDAIWPRETMPRVLPVPVAKLLISKDLLVAQKRELADRINGRSSVQGVAGAEAKVLGKLYEKQIDVGMSRWETGPEILISTKRMDGSYGKNLANRAEESYGDAKNLRLRYPLAAFGFIFALRSDVLTVSQKGARAVVDRLTKLEREHDAYDSTCLLLMEYETPTEWPETPSPDVLPTISLRWDAMPRHLDPNTFFTKMVRRVLEVTPESFHPDARARLATVEPDGLPAT